jgi:hypothetical protein
MASLKGLVFILLKKTGFIIANEDRGEREGHAEKAWFF